MSYDIKYEGECEITCLATLQRAVQLATNGEMRVEETQKSSRRYGSTFDPCDAAITWNKELSEDEKYSHWEIGLRFDGQKYDIHGDSDMNRTSNPLFKMVGNKCQKLFNCYNAVVQMDVAEVQGDTVLEFSVNQETGIAEMLVEAR